ncbi:MAG: protein arginine kinase [Planctomycetota bacterium]|nr:MAG: protein arginine kinase [Planctomycetota bacterium]
MSDSLSDVARSEASWLRGDGPLHEIVISTRIRLARNITEYPFLSRADEATRAEIARTVAEAVARTDCLADLRQLDVEQLDDVDRGLLVERQLISRQHAESDGARLVAFDRSEACSLMINEEDHLRIQVMRSGLQLDEAWEQIDAIDNALDARLEFAFHPQFGYLTACPTNVGTGIRVSVMLHLPALKLTKEFEKVERAARDMRLAVRGLFGEGTDALGDFFQISNQITLGKSELEIIDEFRDEIIPRIVDYEQKARQALLDHRLHALDDKIFRALGTLQTSRLMSSTEAMRCLSAVRMGLHIGRVHDVTLQTINELFLHTQPAHLQVLQGERLSGEQRSVLRASMIRSRLHNN